MRRTNRQVSAREQASAGRTAGRGPGFPRPVPAYAGRAPQMDREGFQSVSASRRLLQAPTRDLVSKQGRTTSTPQERELELGRPFGPPSASRGEAGSRGQPGKESSWARS